MVPSTSAPALLRPSAAAVILIVSSQLVVHAVVGNATVGAILLSVVCCSCVRPEEGARMTSRLAAMICSWGTVAPPSESFSSTGSGLFAAVYASSTQGSSLSAPTVHTCSATATGYTPMAMAASVEPHPHVATRVGSRGMVVFPKASLSVTGKESETAAAVGAVGAVAVGVLAAQPASTATATVVAAASAVMRKEWPTRM